MDEHYRRSHPKTTECRVCSKTLIQQNYQAHLKRKHPDEDCNDLRPRDQRTLISFLESHDTKEDEDDTKEDKDDTKEDKAALTIQSLENNTVTDAGFCSNKESGKLNENESDHTEECEAKGNEHDQILKGQSQIQEEMLDHQEYNEAENLKESDDGSPESRRSTRKILAQLIKKGRRTNSRSKK
jgi:phage FluMu protein Com